MFLRVRSSTACREGHGRASKHRLRRPAIVNVDNIVILLLGAILTQSSSMNVWRSMSQTRWRRTHVSLCIGKAWIVAMDKRLCIVSYRFRVWVCVLRWLFSFTRLLYCCIYQVIVLNLCTVTVVWIFCGSCFWHLFIWLLCVQLWSIRFQIGVDKFSVSAGSVVLLLVCGKLCRKCLVYKRILGQLIMVVVDTTFLVTCVSSTNCVVFCNMMHCIRLKFAFMLCTYCPVTGT